MPVEVVAKLEAKALERMEIELWVLVALGDLLVEEEPQPEPAAKQQARAKQERKGQRRLTDAAKRAGKAKAEPVANGAAA